MIEGGKKRHDNDGLLASRLSFLVLKAIANLAVHAAKFTMTDEEVFCVCCPTDEEPAFRRSDDRISHFCFFKFYF